MFRSRALSTHNTTQTSLPSDRHGISLLEIVLALGIFLGTFAVISQIINTGARAAMQAQAENEATLRAERILNEVLAGALPFASAGPVPFDDDARWTWAVDITSGPHPDLQQIQVSASRQRKDGVTDMTIALTRYTRDPQLYLDAAATATTTVE
ncbi:MAG: hypothetical protein KDA90_10180 [Planctomycetaceae bacterium]|nr:hypothetical protein [Planctomycetaceae bacterium]